MYFSTFFFFFFWKHDSSDQLTFFPLLTASILCTTSLKVVYFSGVIKGLRAKAQPLQPRSVNFLKARLWNRLLTTHFDIYSPVTQSSLFFFYFFFFYVYVCSVLASQPRGTAVRVRRWEWHLSLSQAHIAFVIILLATGIAFMVESPFLSPTSCLSGVSIYCFDLFYKSKAAKSVEALYSISSIFQVVLIVLWKHTNLCSPYKKDKYLFNSRWKASWKVMFCLSFMKARPH